MGIDEVRTGPSGVLKILEMSISNKKDQLDLRLKFSSEHKVSEILFYNVSRIRITNMSPPFVIYGFEIINHTNDGWEKQLQFEIRDFEDDCIHFFCERYRTGTHATF